MFQCVCGPRPTPHLCSLQNASSIPVVSRVIDEPPAGRQLATAGWITTRPNTTQQINPTNSSAHRNRNTRAWRAPSGDTGSMRFTTLNQRPRWCAWYVSAGKRAARSRSSRRHAITKSSPHLIFIQNQPRRTRKRQTDSTGVPCRYECVNFSPVLAWTFRLWSFYFTRDTYRTRARRIGRCNFKPISHG